ncbi:MAG TPA: TlpA disulfide reductase family protein [Candidatus Dormibacteraeota bacterium]|nr:TlpA disulfide reductase family protein [Candidatus Dormibacteraeota bacterium]
MQNRRTLAYALVTIAILGIIVAVVVVRTLHPPQNLQNASYAPAMSALQTGSAAPEFRIPSTAGLFDLDRERRPVLVEIFASWCPHCQHETAVLNRLYGAFESRVAFIAIPGSTTGMDGSSPESEADLLNFIERFHVAYPVAVFDPQLTVANEYIQGGFPTIAVVGTNKKILYVSTGEIPYQTLASALNKAR